MPKEVIAVSLKENTSWFMRGFVSHQCFTSFNPYGLGPTTIT